MLRSRDLGKRCKRAAPARHAGREILQNRQLRASARSPMRVRESFGPSAPSGGLSCVCWGLPAEGPASAGFRQVGVFAPPPARAAGALPASRRP